MTGTQNNFNLGRLIRDRKEEKRRKEWDKLLEDQKVIADRRKYKENLQPFPEGSFERLKGNEVWEKVFQYINDSSDVTSASSACHSFGDILKEKRTMNSFPGVVKILVEKEKHEERDPVVELLSLRGVSKSWKKIFDRAIFEHPFTVESWHNKINLDEICCGTDVFDLDPHQMDHTFSLLPVPETGEIKKATFLRKLVLDRTCLPRGVDTTGFFDNVLKFMDIYGESIWFFRFIGNNDVHPPPGHYDYVRQMIMKMPNLKSLTLEGLTGLRYQSQRGMADMLDQHPFPALQSLEHFRHELESEFLVDQIFQNCPKLKSATFQPRRRGLFYSKEVKKALKLEQCIISFNSLSLFGVIWPLKVLELQGSKCSVLWPILNRFSGTLEKLTIHGGVRKDDSKILLKLPHLKELEVDWIVRGTIGFDDFLHLKSLEKLSIKCYEEEERSEDQNGLVKIYGIQKEMEKSNIWDCFPCLKEFNIASAKLRCVRHCMTLRRK